MEIHTGLKPWAEFSLIEKVLLALGEIFGASRWGPFPFACLLNCFFLSTGGMVFCGLCYTASTKKLEKETTSWQH
jgi:hypothetical protein